VNDAVSENYRTKGQNRIINEGIISEKRDNSAIASRKNDYFSLKFKKSRKNKARLHPRKYPFDPFFINYKNEQ